MTTIPTSIRLPKAIHERVAALAAEESENISRMVARLIEEALGERAKERSTTSTPSPLTLASPPEAWYRRDTTATIVRRQRSQMCRHRILPTAYCRSCD